MSNVVLIIGVPQDLAATRDETVPVRLLWRSS